MQPHKATITGAIGIKAGLGLDELTIDFDQIIQADALTVAIRGDNGSGKSTVMNLAMTPHLNPPMLDGHAIEEFGPEGARALDWSHNGGQYKTDIRYKQTEKTKDTKAKLLVLTDGQWRPVKLPDLTESDGKVRTYNQCLEHILGPESVYYLSAFRAQGAPRLADYEDAEGLMRDLLGLEEIQKLGTSAHAVWKGLSQNYEAIRVQAEALTEKNELLTNTTHLIAERDMEIPNLQKAQQTAQKTHAVAKAEYDRAMADDLDREKIREERRRIEDRIDEISRNRESMVREIKKDDRAIGERQLKAHAAHNATIDRMTRDKAAVKGRMTENRHLLARADEIAEAEVNLEKLSGELSALKEREEALRLKNDEKVKLSIELTGINATVRVVEGEGRGLGQRLKELKSRAGLIKAALFGEKCEPCPLLTDAVDARDTATTTEAQVNDARHEWQRLSASAKEKKEVLDAMGDTKAAWMDCTREVHQCRRDAESAQEVAKLMPALKMAEKDIELGKRQLQEIADQLTKLNENHEAQKQEYEVQLATMRAKELRVVEDAIGATREQEKLLASVAKLDGDDLVAPAAAALVNAGDALNQSAIDLETAVSKVTTLRVQKDALTKEIDAGEGITEKAGRISEAMSMWSILRTALTGGQGVAGIINLVIEDAGPGIADTANRLLSEAYGPRFTVKIVTQRKNKSNDRVKEVFDISVIDSETDTESSITKKSGGESVWLDKALTDSVGIYHQDSVGAQFETQFSDEKEDGLTAERKQQYYRMNRKALEVGGYTRQYFVSHNPDAWQMADAVIDMDALRQGI